jgi:hypothetical protein
MLVELLSDFTSVVSLMSSIIFKLLLLLFCLGKEGLACKSKYWRRGYFSRPWSGWLDCGGHLARDEGRGFLLRLPRLLRPYYFFCCVGYIAKGRRWYGGRHVYTRCGNDRKIAHSVWVWDGFVRG